MTRERVYRCDTPEGTFVQVESPPQAAALRPTIFVVDHDPELRRQVGLWLGQAGYDVRELDSGEACIEALANTNPSAVLMDFKMPAEGGLSTLEVLKSRHRFLPVVVLTGEGDLEAPTVQQGAYDFMQKPVARNKLLTTVQNAVAQHRMAVRLAELEREIEGRGFPGLIGQCNAIKELNRQMERLAASDVSVYIHGESGTGKELVARAIHGYSGRREGPFVAINCAAIPESLQESELFGHERGSFTGASAKRVGRFEQASGGTLFLDEVAELSLSTQSKLLRVLQERKLQRVGGTQDIAVDFRLLAATHRDLLREVRAGRFREDLYFRIVVYELEVPPLRERASDIPLLVEHFMRLHAPQKESGEGAPPISAAAMELLMAYAWPGNIRELENAVQRAAVSCNGREIVPVDLPPTIRLAVAKEDAKRRGTTPEPELEPLALAPLFPPAPASAAAAPDRLEFTDIPAVTAPRLPVRPAVEPPRAPPVPERTDSTELPDMRLGGLEPPAEAAQEAPARPGNDWSFVAGMTLAEVERRVIEEAILRCDGNRSLAAQQLGIGRTTLYRKLKEYGLR